ncbi:MAG: RES family NAD+ phosphorylase [Desulfotalea sp.]
MIFLLLLLFFDETGHTERELIYFLSDFVRQVSEPIKKNGQEHIEYVASQIISEFFTKEFKTSHDERLDGLMYPSSIRPGGINVVLFPPENEFKDLVSLKSAKEVNINTWDQVFTVLE